MEELRHARVLVLGLGNLLLGDEGVGVQALEHLLASYHLPEQVQTIDGGTLGLYLLPYLEDVTDLLVIDSVQCGRPPGTLVRLEGDEIPVALAIKMSVHQIGLQELLAVCRLQGMLPSRIVVWGVEPVALEPGLDLSPEVARQLDPLVQAVAQELRDWGAAVEHA